MTDIAADTNVRIGSRLAIILIVAGLVFALDTVLATPFTYKLWPLLVAIPAIGFIGIFVRSRVRNGAFLAAGIYLACFSVLALYCNLTSWSVLAVLWPLFIAFIGLACVALHLIHRRSRRNLLTGLLLLSLAAVFLVVGVFGGSYWWSILVLAGLSLLATELVQ